MDLYSHLFEGHDDQQLADLETLVMDATAASTGFCEIEGTLGDDRLVGTPGEDVICGLAGRDRIFGLGGQDYLLGGRDGDVIYGGRDGDEVVGGQGRDRLYGGIGADHLEGGAERDDLAGKEGRDFIDASDRSRRDHVWGGPGHDAACWDDGDIVHTVENDGCPIATPPPVA